MNRQHARPLRILLIEDDKDHVQFFRSSIRSLPSFELRIARTIIEARKIIKEEMPDLVVADLELSKRSKGTDILEGSIEQMDFPVILLTAFGSQEMAVDAIKRGAIDYLIKTAPPWTEVPRAIARAIGDWKRIQERRRDQQKIAFLNLRLKRQALESDRRYRDLFDHCPISLWEEDWSAVQERFDELRFKHGVQDIESYLAEKPSEIVEFAKHVKIKRINRRTRELLELREDSKSPKCLGEILQPNAFPAFSDELISLFRGEREFQTEIPHTRKSGETWTVYIHLNNFSPPHRKLSDVIVSVENITDRKRAQDSVHELNLQLATKEVLEQATAQVAHKLKNPAFFMLGDIKVLRNLIPNASDQIVSCLERIDLSATRINDIVNQFNEYAKVTSSKIDKLNLRKLLEEISHRFSKNLGKWEMHVAFQEVSNSDVNINKDWLVETIEELLGNSMHCMPHGGAISLSLNGPIAAGAKPFPDFQSDYFLITVEDNGPGVPNTYKSKIFDLFFSTRAGGTGFGLASARKCCRAMGCDIVEDGPGRYAVGARFNVGVPIPP